jgi:hypothetical protein
VPLVPAPPQLDGVAFRRFRPAADHRGGARIITACAAGQGNDRLETVEHTACVAK